MRGSELPGPLGHLATGLKAAPSRRFVPLKVRTMIDFLEAEFRLTPSVSAYGA